MATKSHGGTAGNASDATYALTEDTNRSGRSGAASGATCSRVAGKNRSGKSRHAKIAEIAARQHGVVAVGQLRAAGFSDSAISREAAIGRLHPIFRGAFAVGQPRVGNLGRLHASLLACGGGTISHGSAAALLGIQDLQPSLIHVIAPRQSGREIDGIRRHFVRPPSSDEMTERDGISCTSPSRTLVDLAGVLGEWSLRRAVEEAAVLKILDVPAIDVILTRGRRRGTPRLRGILNGWRTPSVEKPTLRSRFEALLYPMLAERGLPIPLTNHKLVAAGNHMEVDFFWPDQRLVVEADGRTYHDNPEAFERDRRRDRDLTLAGYRPVRITWAQLQGESTATLAAIRRLLAR